MQNRNRKQCTVNLAQYTRLKKNTGMIIALYTTFVLGDLEARRRVGAYFVSATGPRKLRFTEEELQASLRKIQTRYSRDKNSENQDILATHGLPPTATLDFNPPDSRDFQAALSFSTSLDTQNPTSQPRSVQDTPLGNAMHDASIFAFLSRKDPYFWAFPVCLRISLLVNIFIFVQNLTQR